MAVVAKNATWVPCVAQPNKTRRKFHRSSTNVLAQAFFVRFLLFSQVLYGTGSSKYPSLQLDSAYPNAAFAVPAGNLGFSVLVFALCAITCIGSLILRRKVPSPPLHLHWHHQSPDRARIGTHLSVPAMQRVHVQRKGGGCCRGW